MKLLRERFDAIACKIASVSNVATADIAELNDDGDRCTSNPNVKFNAPNGVIGISFVECEDERTEGEEKPWMWWLEGMSRNTTISPRWTRQWMTL